MKKITYLIGAGASANALPVVKKIPEQIRFLIKILRNDEYRLSDEYFNRLSSNNFKTQYQYQIQLIDDFNWLIEQCESHASIDTFAKKLSIKNDSLNLLKLKVLTSVFFSFKQSYGKPDPRYDAFFASILDSIHSLPENIRILSWNYDSQFEIAFSEFLDDKEISASESWLGVKSKKIHSESENEFGIFKLNGTAICFEKEDYGQQLLRLIEEPKFELGKKTIEKIVESYALAISGRFKPALSFSWEPDLTEKKYSVLDEAIRATHDTEVLVIIGYSFPFFNRKVDKQLLNSMGHLKQIYFQSPDANKFLDRIKGIFKNSNFIEIEPLTEDLDQFFLPFEL